jgi:hypothetical protein
MSATAKENWIQPKQCIIQSSEFQWNTKNDSMKKITKNKVKQGDLSANSSTSRTLKKKEL